MNYKIIDLTIHIIVKSVLSHCFCVTVEPMESHNTIRVTTAEVQLPSDTAPGTPSNIQRAFLPPSDSHSMKTMNHPSSLENVTNDVSFSFPAINEIKEPK
jgi:hypothetical protein